LEPFHVSDETALAPRQIFALARASLIFSPRPQSAMKELGRNAPEKRGASPMQVPLDISFQNSEPSEEIRAEVERQAKRLEKFHGRITSCNVTVIAPQSRHQKGGLYKIDIRVAMPSHRDVFVTRSHEDVPEHEHYAVAIKDAFGAAQRQIEDVVRDLRGDVKIHEAEDHGRVSKLFADEAYGFIETSDGREVYFHRNSVLDDAFDRLDVGSQVRFVEEMGEKGPQASTVRAVGKHHLD
jgi:cold shock CspA family protein/ribosome-associated translation inhibitor RaiA